MVTVLFILIAAQQGNQRSPILNPDYRQLDSVLNHYIENNKLAGVAALIYHEDTIVYYGEFGYQSIEERRKINSKTLFRLASMTKPIVSVAMMQLVESGMVHLDDRVDQYLPGFLDLQVFKVDGQTQPLDRPITISDVLMHTSGLAYRGWPDNPAHAMLANHDFSSVTSLKEYVDELALVPLAAQPGSNWFYSSNTDIVARVIEVVTGMKIDHYLSQHVFQPLGMNDTNYSVPHDELNRLGPIYGFNPTGGLRVTLKPDYSYQKFPAGNTGLHSTIHDYMNFARMLLNGGDLEETRILKEESIKLMTSDLLDRKLFPIKVGDIPIFNNGFGLGFAVVNGEPENWQKAPEMNMTYVGNLPGRSYYWLGIFNTNFWIDPFNKVIGLVMAQSSEAGKVPVFQHFYETFYETLDHPISKEE